MYPIINDGFSLLNVLYLFVKLPKIHKIRMHHVKHDQNSFNSFPFCEFKYFVSVSYYLYFK